MLGAGREQAWANKIAISAYTLRKHVPAICTFPIDHKPRKRTVIHNRQPPEPMEPHVKAGIFVSLATTLLISYSTIAPATAGDAETLASRLVGTWQVIEVVDTDPAGKVSHPYGEHPTGYIVYDPTGHLHVQLMRTPATRPFAAGDDSKGTDQEVRAAYDGYVAYFGTYQVIEAQSKVIHRVEGSLMPSYTGTDQPRPIKIVGDELIIGGTIPEGSYLRRFRRVK